MANALTLQVVTNGQRNASVKVVALLDTSDLAATDIVDPASFSPVPAGFRIDSVEYSVSDQLEAQILWDANTDVVALALAGRGHMDFKKQNGLQNNSGVGKTGKIQLKTTGWASGIQIVTLNLRLVKQYTSLPAL